MGHMNSSYKLLECGETEELVKYCFINVYIFHTFFYSSFMLKQRISGENYTQIDILICDYCGNNLKTCHWL